MFVCFWAAKNLTGLNDFLGTCQVLTSETSRSTQDLVPAA